jgi:hypothetical protein
MTNKVVPRVITTSPKIELTSSSDAEGARQVVEAFQGIIEVIREIREFTPNELRRKPKDEEGLYSPKDLTIRIEAKRQQKGRFKALLLHELAHALIFASKKRMNPRQRRESYGTTLAGFFVRTIKPSLLEIERLSVKKLGTTYIDDLFLESRKSSTAFVQYLGDKAEEVLCDLFALYCLTEFNGLNRELSAQFEALLEELELPSPEYSLR